MREVNWIPKAEHFPKKNALTPIGALSFGLFAVAAGASVILGDSLVVYVLLGLAALSVVVTIWGFIHFAKTDPDRLQTEDYRIQRDIVAKVTHFNEFGYQHIPPPDSPPVPRIGS